MRTLPKFLRRLRQSDSSSRDSRAALTQVVGGWSHRSQSRQNWRVPSRGIPEEMSTVDLMLRIVRPCCSRMGGYDTYQSKQRAPAEAVPSMGEPQLQQRILSNISTRKRASRARGRNPRCSCPRSAQRGVQRDHAHGSVDIHGCDRSRKLDFFGFVFEGVRRAIDDVDCLVAARDRGMGGGNGRDLDAGQSS